MHVLYLHQYFVPPDGSGGTRSYEMSRRLVRAGHEVTLITSSAWFPPHYACHEGTRVLDMEGVRLVVLNVPYSNKLSYRRRIGAFATFARLCSAEAAKAKRVDVVFATSTPLTIALPAIAAKLWHRCPMVFEVRDVWPEVPIAMGVLRNPIAKALARMLELAAYRSATAIVALSPGMKSSIVRSGVPPEDVTVIPNFANPQGLECGEAEGRAFTRRLVQGRDGPLVLYMGTLGAVNGVDYLVEIAQRMAALHGDVSFLIVGDGRELDRVRARAVEAGVLGNNLFMARPVTKSDVPKLLAACTTAVSLVVDIPALWNNSANKFFEALAAGRPIAINHGGWQSDLLEKTGAGITLPARDPIRAAEQLARFVRDPGRLTAARAAARGLAARSFHVDSLSEQLRNVLETAAMSRSPRGSRRTIAMHR
jgi:glycosyltransferase involved in cell wall biosynthesis